MWLEVDTWKVWSEEGMLKSIEIWGEDNFHVMLKGCKHKFNNDVFNKISCQMEADDYKKTADQCNNKMLS